MPYEKSNKLHIVIASAAIRSNEGRYLLLKRHPREIAHPERWCFPGGKVEGEDTIEQALIKEIKEEAGLTMKSGVIFLKSASFTRPDGQTVKVFSFLCEVEDGEVKFDTNDFTEFKWVTLDELKTLPHVGIEEEIKKAEEIISLGISLDKLKTISEKPWD